MPQDQEMADAVIAVLAEASQSTSEDYLNPFRAQLGETLPSNVELNFSGF